MEMKFVRLFLFSRSDSPVKLNDGAINTMHIKRIVEQPASDDEKIAFGLKFKKKKMIETVCELQCVNDIRIRIPYTEAEFMKMYENT
jgi:hypothetical protein